MFCAIQSVLFGDIWFELALRMHCRRRTRVFFDFIVCVIQSVLFGDRVFELALKKEKEKNTLSRMSAKK